MVVVKDIVPSILAHVVGFVIVPAVSVGVVQADDRMSGIQLDENTMQLLMPCTVLKFCPTKELGIRVGAAYLNPEPGVFKFICDVDLSLADDQLCQMFGVSYQ